MYRSHRRQREGGNQAVDQYEWRQDDVRVFEGSQGLDLNFKLRVLSSLLQCPLCEGYFRDAHTVLECLHTFCKPCIMRLIATGNLKCPTCDELLPANPLEGIELDRITQNIVDKIFPQFREIEKKERQMLNDFCNIEDKSVSLPKSSESHTVTRGQSAPYASQYTPTTKLSCPEIEDEVESWEGTKEFFLNLFSKNFKISSLQNISIALMPYDPSITKELARPYIRTSTHTQVQHVMRYLAKKLGVQEWSHVSIILEDQVIHSSHTLEFVFKSRRLDASKCILLRYKIQSL